MSSNIEDQEFWNMIAYSAKQQAKQLIKLKTRLSTLLYASLIAVIIAIIYFFSCIYGKNKTPISYMTPIFIFLLVMYFFTIYISSVKKEFDDVKKQSMDFIKNEGCSCMDKYCEHKDQYIKYMNDEKHINLSYK